MFASNFETCANIGLTKFFAGGSMVRRNVQASMQLFFDGIISSLASSQVYSAAGWNMFEKPATPGPALIGKRRMVKPYVGLQFTKKIVSAHTVQSLLELPLDRTFTVPMDALIPAHSSAVVLPRVQNDADVSNAQASVRFYSLAFKNSIENARDVLEDGDGDFHVSYLRQNCSNQCIVAKLAGLSGLNSVICTCFDFNKQHQCAH